MFRRVGILRAAPMFRAVFVVIAMIAIVLTALILLYFWSWLNPVDFWQKLVAVIVTVISGVVLFIIFSVIFSILIMRLIMRRMMRKMMRKVRGKKGSDKTGYV